jgi:hypothetical protein
MVVPLEILKTPLFFITTGSRFTVSKSLRERDVNLCIYAWRPELCIHAAINDEPLASNVEGII